MDKVFSFIGEVVIYAGGSAALAYIIFMFFGQKWIEAKFAERLESFKHAQERELEQYRHQVNVLFSRVTKIHEKEIEVLPEMWHKLQDALGYAVRITSFLKSSPDFRSMTQEEFDKFLENSELDEVHKKDLSDSPDRNTFYTETIFWYRFRDAKSAFDKFHNFMLYKRIFLSQDLKQEFQKIDNLLLSTLNQRAIGEQTKDWAFISKGYKELDENAEKIVARIEKLVQERLEFGRAISTIESNTN